MKINLPVGKQKNLQLLIIVASLGYFVDIYDLILFNVVKKESLLALGYEGLAAQQEGVFLFNMQMMGMLLGGLLWGILGDKKGRVKVLFGSILLYSLANIANAFVTDVHWYAIIRFLAGVGLAGELGAGITLVSESMDKEKRGYGTMIIVTFGALGAVFAALIANKFDWQTSYLVGGGLGLLLLLIRMGTLESAFFKHSQEQAVKKGDFLSFLAKPKNLLTYLACIGIGLPIWYVIGLLIALCEGFAKHSVIGEVNTGTAIMWAYIGLSLGDLFSGILSQVLRSRKKVVYSYLVFCLLLSVVYLFSSNISENTFYVLCLLLGIGTGYWALFVTISAEQFGTNIRATVTTTAPNFVRFAVVPITLAYQFLSGYTSIAWAALIVGLVCIALAYISTSHVQESFAKDLDYNEEL